MSLLMINLEEVQMIELSDDVLESTGQPSAAVDFFTPSGFSNVMYC